MDLNDFNQSKYLARHDVPAQGLLISIKGFTVAELPDGVVKLVIHADDPVVKPMLLNRTNRKRLEAIFKTTKTERMVGQKLVIYDDPLVEFKGEIKGGLRIRGMGQVSDQYGTAPPIELPPPLDDGDKIPF